MVHLLFWMSLNKSYGDNRIRNFSKDGAIVEAMYDEKLKYEGLKYCQDLKNAIDNILDVSLATTKLLELPDV